MCEYCVRDCSNTFHTLVFLFDFGKMKAYIFFSTLNAVHFIVTCNTIYCDTEMKETIAWTKNGRYNASELRMFNHLSVTYSFALGGGLGGAEKHLKILTKDCNLSFNVVNYDLYSIPKISGDASLELSRKGQKRIVVGACRLHLLTY